PDGVLGYSAAPSGPARVIDNGAAGFGLTGSWATVSGGLGGSSLQAAAGDGGSAATWTFTGLTPGATYQVAATWPANPAAGAGAAPYTVLDGGQVVAAARPRQYVAPSGFSDGGAAWQVLATVWVASDTLVVRLANGPGAGGTVSA